MRLTTRREFLVGAGRFVVSGSAVVATGSTVAIASSLLSSCGGTNTSASLPDDVQIVQRFPQNLVAGPLRLPLSLASGGGLLTT
ncbi:MAG: hypothetical protein EBT38_00925, partial [Acidimicrobiia bacterium]|nr:hypothetical protein [Acidimicrobiia bacterium]